MAAVAVQEGVMSDRFSAQAKHLEAQASPTNPPRNRAAPHNPPPPAAGLQVRGDPDF